LLFYRLFCLDGHICIIWLSVCEGLGTTVDKPNIGLVGSDGRRSLLLKHLLLRIHDGSGLATAGERNLSLDGLHFYARHCRVRE